MRKFASIMLMIIIVMSFSGCLKDDYEALEEDIVSINEETDDLKDDIDLIKEKNNKLTDELKTISGTIKALEDEADDLYLQKEHIEERIDIVSDTGLKITKFQFEEAFYELEKLDEFFTDLSISYLPYQSISDQRRKLYYFIYENDKNTSDFFFILTLCEDNLHIKEMHFIANETMVDTYNKTANKYLFAFCYSFIMAKENNYDDIGSVEKQFDIMTDEEPLYNNTAIYDMVYEDGYYLGSILDISN